MSQLPLIPRARFDTACTIEIEHSSESLHAHVQLANDLELQPGDEVRVHGAPIKIAFGERMVLKRTATISRANWLERAWTKLAARFDLAELYEVSFSTRRTL
jgi:hypothetical protein